MMTKKTISINWGSWWSLSRSKFSMIRWFEQESILGTQLNGRILDVGGGENMHYHRYFVINGEIETVNSNMAMNPSVCCDLNKPMAFKNNCYNTVISFNTLEHIENDNLATAEIIRVLREGGEFHIFVPFLFRVHGSPYDFSRLTFQAWNNRFRSIGLDPACFTIQPLVWDFVATAYSLFESAIPRFSPILRPLFLLPGLFYSLWKRPGHVWEDYALGYYIYGTKCTKTLD